MNIIEKVESTIQVWNDAKEAKFWLPWPTVCPGLEKSDYSAYAKACQTLERTDLERGFRIYRKRRRIVAFFVFDRQTAQDDGSPPPEVNVHVWEQFIVTFEECYLACRDDLKDALAELRMGRSSWDNYTMAHELFAIDPTVDTAWWSNIKAKITWLQSRDPPFLPTPKPMEVASEAPDAKRRRLHDCEDASIKTSTRSSGGQSDIEVPDFASEKYHAPPERMGIIESATVLERISDKCMYMTAVEEWLLCSALNDEILRKKFHNSSPEAFQTTINELLTTELNSCGSFPVLFTAEDSNGHPRDLPGLGAPARKLRAYHLRQWYKRYISVLCGKQVSREREDRSAIVRKRVSDWYATQLFQPPPGTLLIVHFQCRYKYYSPLYTIHAKTSGFLRGELADDQSQSTTPSKIASTTPSSSSSTSSMGSAMKSPNKHHQLLLSNRSILVLVLDQLICGISDQTMLSHQYLMVYLHTGTIPSKNDLLQITMYGEELGHRARQIQHRLMTEQSLKAQSSLGSLYYSDDASNIDGSEHESRTIYHFDDARDRPTSLALSNAPIRDKDAESIAQENFDVLSQFLAGELPRICGGPTDSAPNARLGMSRLINKIDESVNGVDDDGCPIPTHINGVVRRVVWLGSPQHKNDLHLRHAREEGFGNKTDMNTPHALELGYKWRAIVTSDRVSKNGNASLWQQAAASVKPGKGVHTNLPGQDHPGRWAVSQKTLSKMWPLIQEEVEWEGNKYSLFAAIALECRSILTPGKWAIDACYQCAVWSESIEIRFSICVELDIGDFYLQEFAWTRSVSKRPGLSHYLPFFRLRELPGHIHNVVLPHAREWSEDHMSKLPRTRRYLSQLTDAPDGFVSNSKKRIAAAVSGFTKSVIKHESYIYREWGIVLQINTTGNAGSVARQISLVAPDLLFGELENVEYPLIEKALVQAQVAVAQESSSECDLFWAKVIEANKDDVRHWLQQMYLVRGDSKQHGDLALEWATLCSHVCYDKKEDPVIYTEFPEKFPIIHRRQCLHVDTCCMDTQLDEASFSVQRATKNTTWTAARFEIMMWWRGTVLPEIRARCREVGKKERLAACEKQKEKGNTKEANTDVYAFRTHGQCYELLKQVDKIADQVMKEGVYEPSVKKNLRQEGSLRLEDEERAKGWYIHAKGKAEKGGYRNKRLVTPAELKEAAKGIRLKRTAEDIQNKAEGPTSLAASVFAKHLTQPYPDLKATVLTDELRHFLPLFVFCTLPYRVLDAANIPAPSPLLLRHSDPSWYLIQAILLPSRYFSNKTKRALVTAIKKRDASVPRRGFLSIEVEAKTKLNHCWKSNTALHKGNALDALELYSRNALLFTSYLGSDASVFFGSFLLNKERRASIGGVPYGGFKSQLPDTAQKCAAAKMAMRLS